MVGRPETIGASEVHPRIVDGMLLYVRLLNRLGDWILKWWRVVNWPTRVSALLMLSYPGIWVWWTISMDPTKWTYWLILLIPAASIILSSVGMVRASLRSRRSKKKLAEARRELEETWRNRGV